jgi:hypothetical protein
VRSSSRIFRCPSPRLAARPHDVPERVSVGGNRAGHAAKHPNYHKDKPRDGTTHVTGQLCDRNVKSIFPAEPFKAQLQIEKGAKEPARGNSDCFLQAIACL